VTEGEPGGVCLVVRLTGARILGVGAGPVAAAKLLPLLEAGAEVHVVAPDAVPAIREASEAGRLTWLRRAWAEEDVEGAVLVVAATADPAINAAVAAAAAARATLCVRVDREGDGSADLAATVRRGPLTLAVSTNGQAPAVARHLRAELDRSYGPEWGSLTSLYGALRRDPAVRAVLDRLPDEERRRRWQSISVPDMLALLREGSSAEAKRAATACLSSSSA